VQINWFIASTNFKSKVEQLAPGPGRYSSRFHICAEFVELYRPRGRHCFEHLYVFEDLSSGLVLLAGNRLSEIRERLRLRLRLLKRLVALASV
jgi:hypothetical protein